MTRKILELEQLRGKIFYSKDLAAYPLVKWPRATYQNQLAGKRANGELRKRSRCFRFGNPTHPRFRCPDAFARRNGRPKYAGASITSAGKMRFYAVLRSRSISRSLAHKLRVAGILPVPHVP